MITEWELIRCLFSMWKAPHGLVQAQGFSHTSRKMVGCLAGSAGVKK